MTTEAQGYENAWQAHLRSARYWEAREGRPPVPEADLRLQWEEEAHRAWLRGEAIAHSMAHEDVSESLVSAPAAYPPETTYRHIHQHGPTLPTPQFLPRRATKEPGAIALPE